MPLTSPPVATPAPTLALAGWLWLAQLAAAAGLDETGREPAAQGTASDRGRGV